MSNLKHPSIPDIGQISELSSIHNSNTNLLDFNNLDNVSKDSPHPHRKNTKKSINIDKDDKDKLISKDIKAIFKSDTQTKNNIKSLKKEVKINDTIVAIISFITIILCFVQLDHLIYAGYEMTDIILTIRTLIIILSVPNSKLQFKIVIFIYRRYTINLEIRKYQLKLKECIFFIIYFSYVVE